MINLEIDYSDDESLGQMLSCLFTICLQPLDRREWPAMIDELHLMFQLVEYGTTSPSHPCSSPFTSPVPYSKVV